MRRQGGFTLVETLVYIAIIGSVAAAFISFILLVSGLRNKMHAIEEVRANERYFDDMIDRSIKEADNVISPGSFSTSSILRLHDRKTGVIRSVYATSGRIVIDDGNISYLSTDDVYISNLAFFNTSASGTPGSVRYSGDIRMPASTTIDFMFQDSFSYNSSIPF